MKKHIHSGFAAIEALLIVAILGILGFTGWFVWDGKNNANNSLRSATTGSTHKLSKKPTQVRPTQTDETANWLLYEPPGKEYTVRLADGWNLLRYVATPNLYTTLNTNLALIAGTKAVVTQVDTGKDAQTGFFINYATQNIDQIVTQGDRQASLQTQDGLKVEKYYYVETQPAQAIGLDKGDIQYTYVIRMSTNRVVVVYYSFQPGMTDYHETVEKVLKTLHFN